MSKKLNNRCPLQAECERTCKFEGHELECDYYYANARNDLVIEDQEKIREERYLERQEQVDLSDLEQEERLGEVTAEIKTLNRQAGKIMLSYAIEIGKRLAEAKELVGHGGWGDYLEHEVSISASSANNFMRVAEEYGRDQVSLFDTDRQAFEDLSYTKAVALLSLPEGERAEFARENNVKEMSTRELQAAIKERDEARKAEAEAKAEQKMAEAAKETMEKQMTMAKEQVESLRRELDELKAKPVEVAVEKTVDKEALAKARKEAEAEKKQQKVSLALKKAEEDMAKLRERMKGVEAERDAAKSAQADAKAEVEKLKKELQVSGNKTVATFGVYFDEVQSSFGKLEDCLEELKKAGDMENHTKLSKAAAALVENFRERVGGEQ